MSFTLDMDLTDCGAFIAVPFVWSRLRQSHSFGDSLILTTTGALASYFLWRRLRQKLSHFSARRKTDINIGFREKFQKEFVFLNENVSSNTYNIHCLAEESIRMFIDRCGFKPYSFSSSTSNTQDNVDCHLIYCYDDLEIPYKYNPIQNDHVLYMMDVNYNYNMQQLLWKGRPIILYSFFPTSVGGNYLDGTFSIRRDKITSVGISGKSYNHKAFYIQGETFVIKGFLHSLLVNVDQFISPLDPERRVICLTPTAWYPSSFNWLTRDWPNKLSTKNYEYGESNFLLTAVMDKEKQEFVPFVSIGNVGGPEELLVEYDEFYKFSSSTFRSFNSYLHSYTPVETKLFNNFHPLLNYLTLWHMLNAGSGKLMCSRTPKIGRIEVKMGDHNKENKHKIKAKNKNGHLDEL